ncbi:nitroreductase [Uliginosibacterium sp. sgz301328]|uniref:nitroreductase family protein n=1 Tax=Uliginosibacterium sp. sgz301328 TaxID=3243764 RepID=UPI00359CCF25
MFHIHDDEGAGMRRPASPPDPAMLSGLLDRRSVKRLRAPVPSDTELDAILDAAVRAPDHGQLRPWRFVVIRDAARQTLADLCAESARMGEPDITHDKLERTRAKILRAPMLIALGAHLTQGHKVPEFEQLMSVAAAGMNILNAAHALGYGAFWVTGAPSQDPRVAHALGFDAPDRLLGFIHLGTPVDVSEPVQRPPGRQFAREWP